MLTSEIKTASLDEYNSKSLKIASAIALIAGTWSLLFEIFYFHYFVLDIYFARVSFTIISLTIFLFSFKELSGLVSTILIHLLIISLISSFIYTIYKIPATLFINSQIISLLIFTTALIFSWEVKNQIIVAIYYNILFAASIIFNGSSIFLLPDLFSITIFVSLISLLSVVASAINYKLREIYKQKSDENNFLFNSLPLGICRTDIHGNIISANKYLNRLLGINDKENKLFNYLLSDTLKENFEKGITKNIEMEVEYEKEGRIRHLNVIADVITDNESAKSYGFIIQDNTEVIIAKHEKERANKKLLDEITEKEKILRVALLQKNQKLQLLAKINHEVRTPLNAILLFHEMVGDNILKSVEEIKTYSKSVKTSSSHLLNTINNFIDYAKIETGKMEVEEELFNIKEEITVVIQLLTPLTFNKNISLYLRIDDDCLNLAFTDAVKYRQIMINLIANSLKFTKVGNVTVFLKNVLVEKDKYMITTIIEDTGIGIPLDKLDYIFDPFVSSGNVEETQHSSGLGLAICKEFIQMLGGNIIVESILGKGSKFTLTLPYEYNPAIQPQIR